MLDQSKMNEAYPSPLMQPVDVMRNRQKRHRSFECSSIVWYFTLSFQLSALKGQDLLDLDASATRRSSLGHNDAENAVLQAGLDSFLINATGEVEAAAEGTKGSF